MQSTLPKYKVPTYIYRLFTNFDSNAQEKWIIVYMSHEETKYIIEVIRQIEDLDLPPLPLSLTKNQHDIHQQIITISKTNKSQHLQTFSECRNDELNEILKDLLIVTIPLQKMKEVQYTLLGYQLNDIQVQFPQLSKLVHVMREKAAEAWSNYQGVFRRSISKKKDFQKDSHSSLLPIFSFVVDPIIAPIKITTNQLKINCKLNEQFIRIVLNNSQKPQEISKKINEILKEKIITNSQNKPQGNQRICIISHNSGSLPLKIFSPHIYAIPQYRDKFNIYMVKGLYEYYHYGDQGFHDNGWGCAYRAYQTLLSWMRFQGFTKPLAKIPTIRQIQQQLDSIDRTRKLKGSSQWIGATQISWLIPKATTKEIKCKILHVADGKQIMERCQEFRYHLETVGCPIMYGGGQYAYSIVGMNYNWKLGECLFLILDPHYTGEDDYGKVIEKKGLAWRKPQEMFKKGIFYNFCLPLVYGK